MLIERSVGDLFVFVLIRFAVEYCKRHRIGHELTLDDAEAFEQIMIAVASTEVFFEAIDDDGIPIMPPLMSGEFVVLG